MRWEEFASDAPDLASLSRFRLRDPGVVLVGTIRQDGSPRLSPVEPLFWAGELWLSMGLGSHKAADLDRDPRILVHSVIADREGSSGEFKVRGRAVPEHTEGVLRGYADEVAARLGWHPEPGRFHLFRVDVDDVTFIRWDPATNDQYVTRWPARQEFVRRGTSDTSLGEPRAFAEFFDPGGPGVGDRPLTVREEQPADQHAVGRVVAAAFGSGAEVRLVEALRASPDFIPGLSLVGELDGQVVGHVMISYAELERSPGDRTRVANLSPLAVAPAFQRRGIGSALVRAVTAEADRRGEPCVVVEGDPRYYGRFGFEHAEKHGVSITLPSWAPPEAAQLLPLRNHDPAMTGHVVYPPAFDHVADR